MTSPLPTLAPSGKCIIVEHTQGKLAGLRRIVGHTDTLPEAWRLGLGAFIPVVDFIDHQAPASLVKVTPRYMLYRELLPEVKV